jgi:hypothetical protein
VVDDRFAYLRTSIWTYSITMHRDIARFNGGVITVPLVIDIFVSNRVLLLFDEGAFGGSERIVRPNLDLQDGERHLDPWQSALTQSSGAGRRVQLRTASLL